MNFLRIKIFLFRFTYITAIFPVIVNDNDLLNEQVLHRQLITSDGNYTKIAHILPENVSDKIFTEIIDGLFTNRYTYRCLQNVKWDSKHINSFTQNFVKYINDDTIPEYPYKLDMLRNIFKLREITVFL